jgi:hypothetical protein
MPTDAKFKVAQPAGEQENPYLPPGPNQPLMFEDFEGINTNTTRPGVDDKQAYWLDGWMPLARRNLRTLPDIGPVLWTAPTNAAIAFFDFANIGTTPYMIAIHGDGGIWAVNTLTGVAKQIAVDGTINNPTRQNTGITQWGSQYVIIVSNQANGYFLWDGTAFYSAGGFGPLVDITNAGSGYQTVPGVSAVGGSGSGAVFAATIANGNVTEIIVVNPGSGYLAGDAPTLALTGGAAAGSSGSLTAVLSNAVGSGAVVILGLTLVGSYYQVTSVIVANGGSGYSPLATITVSGGRIGLGGGATLSLVIVGGIVQSVLIVTGGRYVSASPAPTAAVTDNGDYYVSSVTINNSGSGYSPSAIAPCSGGGSPTAQATLALTLVGGIITAVTVVSGGAYGSNTPPGVTVTDSTVTATATAQLMPFAIQGTYVETYAGRVWVAGGPTVTFAAPGSFVDFSSATGGGNFSSSDSFLRVAYVALLQTNGFLYLIGDSSVNYISGVQTSGSPTVVTTFTNQNADPEVGTSFPGTVDVFGRNIVFANSYGAHVSYGAAVTKISEALDGVYSTVPNFGEFFPSAAKAIIYSKKVWILLLPIVDPVTQQRVNKLLMWNGKIWWAATQSINLQFIQHQEINSVLTAYGTDGLAVYPLFQRPSVNFTKTAQTRLWDTPGGYQFVKAPSRLWGLAQYYDPSSPSLTITIDNENQTNGAQYVVSAARTANWTTANGSAANWTTQSAQPSIWQLAGIGAFGTTQIAQNGVLIGETITTNCADMALISTMMTEEIVQYRG